MVNARQVLSTRRSVTRSLITETIALFGFTFVRCKALNYEKERQWLIYQYLWGKFVLMELLENFDIKPLNTFGISSHARWFAEACDCESLLNFIQAGEKLSVPLLILGGGSNVLFVNDFDGIIIRLAIKGVSQRIESNSTLIVEAAAGESWELLVEKYVAGGWGGIENLAMIPGSVGAAPIQNIGAYGVELKDVLVELEALDINNCTVRRFSNQECNFGYRTSIFKQEAKSRFVILKVALRLNRGQTVNLSYPGLAREVLSVSGTPTISDVANAVKKLRAGKLPDPTVLGNAGSFFKNPEVDIATYQCLKYQHPGLVAFPTGNNWFKLSAAWLIEQCGWKGYRNGDAGVYYKQPLVLVNYGNASGVQILDLASRIRDSVEKHFDIRLVPEVNIIG